MDAAAQLASLRSAEANTLLLLRRARKQLKRRQAVRQMHLEVSRFLALIANDGCQTAAAYLARRWPDESTLGEAVAVMAANRAELSPSDVAWEAQLPRPKRTTEVACEAEKFLREARLFQWVESQNMERGLAPASGTLSALAISGEAAASIVLRPKCTRRQSSKQWMRRWRRRWEVSLGKIPIREQMPPDVQRAKAQPRGNQN